MKKTAVMLAAVATAIAAPGAMAKSKAAGEKELAEMLEGRVAGEPVSCLSRHQTRDVKVIDKTAIVYGRGHTIYVNRPVNADRLDDDDILVTRSSLSQLCSVETVQLYDRTGNFWTGFVGLSKFVPYKRVAVAD
ncbi:hypothetical protein GCM10011371_25970 [Novosphingobium marinum]|uniref:Uncharacterized protein n=1 Tax=Novosphingobium marinum TaxID=1514948 RepID=A0A7Z0BU47_9SPHN|nr:hypothetical protein [Novosphingobium marinum]NYH94788.1 hypothetical protein [Novosphingobium marinum]GGC37330.1 hypothetical protein GCM10011371_25970 [Novosphingobium marinum]